ncbi:hypothetical protein QAD02_003870 [Eretmocerus hayati]|uniref:Uncharacterized protein n=1 Tax=Eretmocerus hayati TaxID=131215 RepID=A0ACC2NPR9_9HYME|nr:hypothetical protein QAD02_003870 [Eretmocerus hayati]
MDGGESGWYLSRHSKLKDALKDVRKVEDNSNILCVAREINESGSRVFYVVEKESFEKFYKNLGGNRPFYEVVCGKCVIYFDIEYNRTTSFFINDERGLRIFVDQLKSLYVKIRILTEDGEVVLANNFNVLQEVIFELQNHILKYTFEASEVKYDVQGWEDESRFLKKYTKNVAVDIQDEQYKIVANEYFDKENREKRKKLLDSYFVDWGIYDKNRNMRMMLSAKLKEPKRVL